MVQKSWDCCVFDVSKNEVYSSKNSCCSATKLPNMFVNRRWFLHGFFFIKISIFANSPETKSQIPDLILSKHRSKTLMFWLKAIIPAPLVSQITSFPPFLSLPPPAAPPAVHHWAAPADITASLNHPQWAVSCHLHSATTHTASPFLALQMTGLHWQRSQ